MKKIIITNQLTKEDYLELKDLYSLFFHETIAHHHLRLIPSFTNKSVQKLKELKKDRTIKFWIARDTETNEIVGFAKAKIYPDAVGLFSHIYVKPEYRGQVYEFPNRTTMIALALTSAVREWFLKMNIDIVEIEISKQNKKMLAINQNTLGFKIVREFPDVYILQKKLGD